MLYFQFRILHNILPTNSLLYKLGIVTSPLCSFCKDEAETVEHLFVDCDIAKQFWIHFKNFVIQFNVNYTAKEILLGNVNTSTVIVDLLYLIAKQYLYHCRLSQRKPNFDNYLQSVWNYKRIEECSAHYCNKTNVFIEKWRGVNQ